MINRIYLSIKVNPEILVVVWRKVNMRNLKRSKRVSEANNSCGLYELFYLREYAWGYALKTSHWDVFKRNLLQRCNKGKRSCSPPTAPSPLSASLTFPRTAGNHPQKCCRIFSPLPPRAKSMAQGCFALCGERPGLPALDLASWSQLDRLSPLRGVCAISR